MEQPAEEEKKNEAAVRSSVMIKSKPVSILNIKSGEYERLDTGITELEQGFGRRHGERPSDTDQELRE